MTNRRIDPLWTICVQLPFFPDPAKEKCGSPTLREAVRRTGSHNVTTRSAACKKLTPATT
jgi:hypothetical protein